ncbi:hypothetical protein BYT27DRAFT_7211935 [Phlegmacium glaucopus]|nr:hypothetical protein BYT27DRAFT_7211935 [Phlegmacium glaucopus]
MEKKCESCDTKEKECVVDKGKRRCTECESSRTKCSFVPTVQKVRTRAATKAKMPETHPRPLKRKRGEKSAPELPRLHVPIVEIIATSLATLPTIPAYLTKNSLDTATNLRLELELAQTRIRDLKEEVL